MKNKMLIVTLSMVALIIGVVTFSSLSYDFKTLNGDTYKHSNLEGSVVVVNYFAEWCAPCLKEIPELNHFNQHKPNNVHLFAISYDDLSADKLLELQKKYNIEFPLIVELQKQFAFTRPEFLPATFVINKKGKVVGQLFGEQTSQGLIDTVSSL